MNKLGIKTVKKDRLNVSGGYRKRLEQPHVRELAASIKEHGLLHYSLVRKADLLVVSGEDRVAAQDLLGREEVEVELIDCTDAEVEELRLVENVQRRHDPKKQAADTERLIELYSARVEPDPAEAHKPGPNKSAKTKARERVATQRGVKAGSVARQQRRQKAKEVAEQQPPDAPAPPTIDLKGIAMPQDALDATGEVVALLTDVDAKLRAAQGAMTAMDNAGLPFSAVDHQRIYESIHDVAAMVRGCMPKVACPFCKAIPLMRDNCVGCVRTGYLMDKQLTQVPRELWNEEDPVVMWGGKLMGYGQAAHMSAQEGQPVPEPEDDDGSDLGF